MVHDLDIPIDFKRSDLANLIKAMPALGMRTSWDQTLFGLFRIREQAGGPDEAYKWVAALSYGLLTVIMANGVLDTEVTRKLIALADSGTSSEDQLQRARELAALIVREPREGDPEPVKGGARPSSP